MSEPRWKQRYRAPALTLPSWAVDDPDRLVYASNLSGSWQIHAWDRVAGVHRQVTGHPTGVVLGLPTRDGAGVVWFEDTRGNDIGRWLVQPFSGGQVTALLGDVEPSWTTGLALGPRGWVAVGLAGRDGFRVRVGEIGSKTVQLYGHEQSVHIADLSRDGRLLAVLHAEHGDNLHPALRVFDVDRLRPLADLWDGKGHGLHAAAFSPLAGDPRLVVLQERAGHSRPALWNPRTSQRVDLDVDLPGEIEAAGWWPDARALLLVHTRMGRDRLHRLDLASGRIMRLEHPQGSISGARVRPNGAVWYRWSSGATPAEVRVLGQDQPMLPQPGPPAPSGVPYESWAFTNPAGQTVHGFLALPNRPGPHPTVILIHGGPQAHYADSFHPEVQAWVDHDYAVALVNYRGSTGYGKAWERAVEGDPGRPEVEDVVAGRNDLIARRIADPNRAVIAGASWGGYVTLQTIGTIPIGWRAAIAVSPVADYVSAYADEAEALQALDRTLFGGSPDEKPDLYRERSPITYAHQVRTPVLLVVGENDIRCPLRQALNYADRLRDLGNDVELDRVAGGHAALIVDERIRRMEVMLRFVARHVPGTATPQT